MARSFVTTDIVTPVKARLRADSFTHMNSAMDETHNAIIKAFLPTYTTNDLIILNGCVITGTVVAPGGANMTAGQIFYNGKVYEVDSVTGLVLAGAQIPVWTLATTYQGGQTTFSDGNAYNFQKIEKLALTAGLSGSGLANYNATTVKFLKKTKRIAITGWNMDTTPDYDAAHGLSAVEWLKINIVGITIFKNDLSQGDVIAIKNTTTGADNGIRKFGATNIEITRETGGFFDAAAWNTATGYIDIIYGDI